MIDADPQARARTVKVKVISPHQPVLPPAAGGAPFVPVEFTGLTVTPYVNQAGRLAYSVKATGVRAPVLPAARRARPVTAASAVPVRTVRRRRHERALESFAQVNVHVGSDWRVRCLPGSGYPPVLDIGAGQIQVSVSLAEKEIRASAVEFAAELAREAARFAAEVERRYADQQTAKRADHGSLTRRSERQMKAGRLELVPPAAPVSPHVRQEAERNPSYAFKQERRGDRGIVRPGQQP